MTHYHQTQIPWYKPHSSKPAKSCKDVFHAYMTRGIDTDPVYDMPVMQPETMVPTGVLPFSEAMNPNCTDYNKFVHFYEHDYQIERFWNQTWKYLPKVSKFAGIISPDFSSTPDMPRPLRQFNIYRNQLLGAWYQSLGYHAICNTRCPESGHDYSIAGAPKHSILSLGAVGCIKNYENRNRFIGGLIRLIDELHPSGLIIVGEDAYGVFDYAKELHIPLFFFQGATSKHFKELAHER